MEIREFQRLMKELYGANDQVRGTEKTYLWFFEEVGELAEALREEDRDEVAREMADVLAWMVSIANILDIDVEEACRAKYPMMCPRCGQNPCQCGR